MFFAPLKSRYRPKIWKRGLLKTSDHIQIKTKIPNSSQEPPASSKTPNEDLEHGCIKDQWPYQNQDQDAKHQSGTSSFLQISKLGLRGHGCSLHIQNKDNDTKFQTCINSSPVTISRSRSRCKTQVRNLQQTPNPQMRT